MAGALAQRRAVVTGGAGGMGRAHALRLARLGADVAILDLDLDVAKQWNEELTAPTVAEEIEALGVESMAIEVDITDAAATEAAIASIASKWSAIDILVNNAGGAITPVSYTHLTLPTNREV